MTAARRALEVAGYVGVLAYLALVFAEFGPADRPVSTDSFSMFAVTATMVGARYAYDHRRAGRLIMLLWGVVAALGMVAGLAILVLAPWVIGPSVRAVAWLPSALIGLAAIVILIVSTRHVVRESTSTGRRIALGEILALGLVAFGLWIAVTHGDLITIGGGIAIAGPIALLWLQRERRRREPKTGSDPQPSPAA